MATEDHPASNIVDEESRERFRTAAPEDISSVLLSATPDILRFLIENPNFDETHACLLLERKDLPGTLLEEISKRKIWKASYRIRRALAAHPHTPRLIAMKLLRELYLMDLVQISLLPSSSGELRRLAEERVVAQLSQLPLGQRLTLARRGSARIAAGLIAQGPDQVARIALDNAFLTESQLLKTLTKDVLPERIVEAIARHEKWSKMVNVRVALLRNPNVPAEWANAFVADLPRRDIEDLLEISRLSVDVREALNKELERRTRS